MLINSNVSYKSQLEFDMVFDPDERIGETEPSRKKVKVEVGDEVNIKYVDPHSFRPNVLRGVVKEIIPDMKGKDPKRSKIIRLDCSKEFNNKLIDIFTDHIIDIVNISNRENKYNAEKILEKCNTILILDKAIAKENKLKNGDSIKYNNFKYVYGVTAFDNFYNAIEYYKLNEPEDDSWNGINIIFSEGNHICSNMCDRAMINYTLIRKPFINIKSCNSDKSTLFFGLYLDNTSNIEVSGISILPNNATTGIKISNESSQIKIENCYISGLQYSISGCNNAKDILIINSKIKKQIYFYNIHNLLIRNCSISDNTHPLLVVENQARCIELENNCLFLNDYMFRDCININKLTGTFELNNNKIYGMIDNVIRINEVYDNSNIRGKYPFNITYNDISCDRFIIYYEGIKSEDRLEDLEEDDITKFYKIVSVMNKMTKSKNIENPLFGPYKYEKLDIIDRNNLLYGNPISTDDKEDNNPIDPDDNVEIKDPLDRTSDLPVVKKFGDDTFVFANGTEITIKDRSDGKEGASIVYNTKDGSEETIDVSKNTHVFGGRHNDDTLTNTRIIIEGGVIKEVFGGGLHKSHTSVANILLYGGKVSTLFGAGSNGCTNTCDCENVKYTLENVKDSHNITDHSIINIFGGTVSGLLFGGGQDMTYTKSSDMYIGGTDNSNINYITVGGSNGYVSSAKLEVYSNTTNIGTIQGINRGIIDSISIDIKCCKEIKKLFCGGETPFIGSKDNPNSSSDPSGKFKTCLVTINKVHSNIGEFALGGNDYEVITEENNDCVTVVEI